MAYGRTPVSALKVTVAVLLGLAAVALAVWLYMRFWRVISRTASG